MGNDRFGHEIHLKERPVGIPTENSFELVSVSVPDPKEANSWCETMDVCRSLHAWTNEGG
jgi:NADPH-dependent curcumin reductase CurA